MFGSTLTDKARGFVLLGLVVAAVAAPLAQASAAQPTVEAAAHSCRTGNAPLSGGVSTNTKAGSGLVARGWDSPSTCHA
jgi:hypothetical protein